MHSGPSNQHLSFNELVAAAQKANSSQLNLLFSQSSDPQFLMKCSREYPAAKQRLIDNLGKWGDDEKKVLTHLSETGYFQATQQLWELGCAPGYEENLTLARNDKKFAVFLYSKSFSESRANLCVKHWVEIARENDEIAQYLVRHLYSYLVYPKDRPKKNPFGNGGYWREDNSELKEGLFALLGYRPSLGTALFQYGDFKLYDPESRNIEFHRLCSTQLIFLNLVFEHATCFSMESAFQIAEKYPATFIQHADKILALPKFQGTAGQGLKALAALITDIQKIVEDASKVPVEAPRLTTAFDQLKISETDAQRNVSTSTASDKKTRRASC